MYAQSRVPVSGLDESFQRILPATCRSTNLAAHVPGLTFKQQKSSFVENNALRNLLELSSKLGEYELSACGSFFFLQFFLFFTLLFVLFSSEVQDCLFKALSFELS